MGDYDDMRGKQETLYDDEGHYDPRKGRSLLDDLLGWAPDFAFRVDAFPPHCLTISGAMSFAVGTVFLMSCVFNVVLPHYERVSHSVQTRCKIMSVERDEYIDDALFHYKVKYPLPGIPGLREDEAYCYGSQRCRCRPRLRSPRVVPLPTLARAARRLRRRAFVPSRSRLQHRVSLFPPRPALTCGGVPV